MICLNESFNLQLLIHSRAGQVGIRKARLYACTRLIDTHEITRPLGDILEWFEAGAKKWHVFV